MMRITYLTPSLRPHGGIRVLVEHCNYLAAKGHDVTLQSLGGALQKPWVEISHEVRMSYGTAIKPADITVAGSPPIARDLVNVNTGGKKFFLLQMAEHLFAPRNGDWQNTCLDSYKVNFPIIGISKFVEEEVKNMSGRRIEYYIGNGVSPDFRPSTWDGEDKPTVMIEGWNGYNQAKDVKGYGIKMAKALREDYGHSVRIIGYGQSPPANHGNLLDKYLVSPDQRSLVELYRQSHVFFKASMFDARSCAPVEAMSCGVPVVRMIHKGDDDLTADNCIRLGYNDLDFLTAFNSVRQALEDRVSMRPMVSNGLKYREENLDWNKHIDKVLQIFAE